MRQLPSGTVTFLFSDIEGSTRLLDELGPDAYASELAEHRRKMRDAFSAQGGVEVDTQGDAFFVAFPTASGALAAARDAQAALAEGPIHVRMGIHSGEPLLTDEGYVGIDVHRGARVMSAGHGGQVLVSAETYALLDGSLELTELGRHRLKDLTEPQPLYQLGAGDFPPLKTLYQSNLPVQPTPLVGRESELAEVLQLLEQSRLVTLTGAGGSGKTRLALQAAAEVIDDHKDGVWWVPLAPLRDAKLVELSIAQVVGARENVVDRLRGKRALLLLDNFEHVLEAAPLVSELLVEAPELRILVTSRERLNTRGEQEYRVPTLVTDEAVALFTARARQLEPGFEPDEHVTEICRRLDGLPLAIELAAARVKVLSPEQVLDRLGRSLDLLTAGARDAPERQRTLRATIGWSYDLLEPDEQALFAQLSVFPGGFALEAAERVCEASVDTLGALVDKSLLRRSHNRCFQLETVREYASERLREAGPADVFRRHATYYLELAESLDLAVEAYQRGADPKYEIASAEHENFRAAMDWSLEADPELGLRIAVALEQFWVAQAGSEGVGRFEALLGATSEVPPDLRARALRCYGGALTLAGASSAAKPRYEESLALFEALGDEWAVIHMRHRLATTALAFDDWDYARRLLEEDLVRARALGSRYLEGEALGTLGVIEDHDGNTALGLSMLRQSIEIARDLDFRWRLAIDLQNAAELSLKLDRHREAAEFARAGLDAGRAMDDRLTTVTALATIAHAASRQGDAATAGRLWGAIEEEEQRGDLGRWQLYREEAAASLRPVMGPEFERARALGRGDSLEDAVELARSFT